MLCVFLPLSSSSTYSLLSIASLPPPFFLLFTDFYLSHLSLTLPTCIFLPLYICTYSLCMYCLPILPLPLSFTNFFPSLLFNSFPLHVTQLPLHIFTYSLCVCDLCFLISEVLLNLPLTLLHIPFFPNIFFLFPPSPFLTFSSLSLTLPFPSYSSSPFFPELSCFHLVIPITLSLVASVISACSHFSEMLLFHTFFHLLNTIPSLV